MAAAPQAPATPAPETQAFEEKAPPTIDSHGGKLSPVNSTYLEPAATILFFLALLSVLAPRRLKAFGGVQLGWTRLLPGLLLTCLVAWTLLPSPQTYTSPSLDYFRFVEAAVNSTMLAFAFLNLLADVLFPVGRPSAARSLLATGVSAAGLLILLTLWSVDWYGTGLEPAISIDPIPPLIGLLGLPLGVGLLFLWRRFNGWKFELAAAFGTAGALILGGKLLPYGNGASGMTVSLAALTVAATLGQALRGMGKPRWRHLSGRALWAWAWILRVFLVASSVAIATF